MVKVKKSGELKWCLEKHATGKVTVNWAANHLKITPRRFKQLYAQYKTTNNTVPTIGQNLGRPKKQITKETIETIKQTYKKYHLNSNIPKKSYTNAKKIAISHRTIHKVLLNLGYAHHQPNKQKRKAPMDSI